MIEQYQQVKDFMRAFGQRVPDEVSMPGITVEDMRERLINEERYELLTAQTPVEKLDAVIDLLYVVLGAGVDCGFTPEQIAEGFAEVHRSNMSKMWDKFDLCEVGDKGGDATYKGEPVTVEAIPCNEESVIVRRPDGKIVKSPSYSPANLGPILEGTK